MCKIFHSISFQQIKTCNINREGEKNLTERPLPFALSGFVYFSFSSFVLLLFFMSIDQIPSENRLHSSGPKCTWSTDKSPLFFGGDPMSHLLCMMIYKANYLPAALIFPNQPALQKDIAAWNREPIGLWWHFLISCLEIKWLFVDFCVKIPTNFKTSFL